MRKYCILLMLFGKIAVMSDGKIDHIVILGGGSAGWMAAAYLSKAFPDMQLTLIESSDIPIVGVGEATIASITRFFNFLELKEADWMPDCHATYKYAIKFNDWYTKSQSYWHPFEPLSYFESQLHLGQFWYYKFLDQKNPDRLRFFPDCFLCVDLLEQNKVLNEHVNDSFRINLPIQVAGRNHKIDIPYAYHLDAGLFGQFLKDKVAKPAGVKHVIDDVIQVHHKTNGFIDFLETKKGSKIKGNLFIDCSGFHSVLIDNTYREPFEEFSQYLYCDRAIAMPVPYTDPHKEMTPFTSASALSSGWVWQTPLTHRVGTGYVYCSHFLSEDAAEKEFRKFLGEKRVKNVKARHLNIRVGKHRNTWVKNCIALGLASGFVEPLESTGLAFIHLSLEYLVSYLKQRHINAPVVSAYNRICSDMIDETRDFLAIHYALTSREDTPFWKEVKFNTSISEKLSNYLARFNRGFPNKLPNLIFPDYSWTSVLVGMNYLPAAAPYNNLNEHEVVKNYALLDKIAMMQKVHKSKAPNHFEFLKSVNPDIPL